MVAGSNPARSFLKDSNTEPTKDPSMPLKEVKRFYLGHEITVWREPCLAGYPLTYYSVFRTSDGYECTSGYTEDDSSLKTLAGYLQERIEEELKSEDPWGEKGLEY